MKSSRLALMPEQRLAQNIAMLNSLNAKRRQNPAIGGVEEQIDWILYDSFSVAANTAVAKQVMFQTGIGGAKTLAQTNMAQGGKLSSDERFVVRQIGIYVSNDTIPADAINISRNMSSVFFVRTKPYAVGTPMMFPAGLGVQVTAVSNVGTVPAGSAPVFTTSNGSLDPRAGFIYSGPGIPIGVNESFSLVLNPETPFSTQNAGNPAGVGTTIYALLYGTLFRGVQ